MKLSKFFTTALGLFICTLGVLCINNRKVLAESFTLCPGFSYEDISPQLQSIMDGKSFKMQSSSGKENDWVRFGDLRYLTVQHWGYDETVHNGEMVVHESVAKEVLEIFKELLDAKFPIYQIKLIENFDVDDEKSMAANNSHCFRIVEGSFNIKRPWHGLGLAIDINPLVNPCNYPWFYPCSLLGQEKCVPANSEKYLNRNLSEKGMIKFGDACYNAFVKRGWEWGGSWRAPVDLHHFQKVHWDTVFPRKYKS